MFRIYKNNAVIVESESPLSITGLNPNTNVLEGEYQVVRVENGKESKRVNIPAFKTLQLQEPDPDPPEQEAIIIPRKLELLKGTTEKLTARETVKWHSANETVLTVTDNGTLTANDVGIAEVIATTSNGKSDKITVVVYQTQENIPDPDNRVGPTAIILEPSEHTLTELGVNKLIKIHIEPTHAETDVEWSISDENILIFRNDLGGRGWIMSRRAGTATVTAKSLINGVEGKAIIHVLNG